MKLGKLCILFTDGDWIESKDQSDSGIRLIQTGNIGNGEFLYKNDKAKYISVDTFKRLNCKEVFPNDILVSRLPEPVGRGCIIPDIGEKMITAVDCTICRINENLVDRKYFCYFLESNAYKTQLEQHVTGTTRKRISRKNLSSIEIDIPEQAKQKEVVYKLDRLKKIIQNYNRELDLLDELIKARFVEMFGDENNSKGWEIVNIEDVANVQVGVVIKPSQYYTDQDSGIKAFRSLNIGNGYIKDDDWVYFSEEGNKKNKKSILSTNDVLVVRSGAPGTACVVTSEYAGSNAIDVIIAHPDFQKVDSHYLCTYTNMPHGKSQIIEGTGGAAQQHFNVGKYNKLKLMLPPLEYQKQYVKFLEEIDKSRLLSNHSLFLIKSITF